MTVLITGARQLARAGVPHLVLPVREAQTGDALRLEIESLGCKNVSTPLPPLRSGDTYCKLLQGQIAIEDNGSYFEYTGKLIAPYLPDNAQAVIDDLLQTSDSLLVCGR